MTTAQLSSIVKVGAGSPTIRVAATNGATTTNYTAPANTPMRVDIIGSSPAGALTIDGAVMTLSTVINISYYIGPGQATTIVSVASSAFVISVNKVD